MSNHNKTPLLRPLRKTGSTLYVFPSASEDIGLNINQGTTGVALSNFCLLNLTKNNFDLKPDGDDTIGKVIARSLQNYCMNFETVLLNEESYNFQEPYTVTEPVFWKWLQKHGLSLEAVDGQTNVYREQHYA